MPSLYCSYPACLLRQLRIRACACNTPRVYTQRYRLLYNQVGYDTRARERAAALKEAKFQRQRTAADKKLQQAITREEKARETIEKKARKEIERTAAREKLAREKAARQAKKEIKKA